MSTFKRRFLIALTGLTLIIIIAFVGEFLSDFGISDFLIGALAGVAPVMLYYFVFRHLENGEEGEE